MARILLGRNKLVSSMCRSARARNPSSKAARLIPPESSDYLLPEEVLFLMECNALALWIEDGNDRRRIVSLPEAWRLLLDAGRAEPFDGAETECDPAGLSKSVSEPSPTLPTQSQYCVYAHLKRLGFHVLPYKLGFRRLPDCAKKHGLWSAADMQDASQSGMDPAVQPDPLPSTRPRLMPLRTGSRFESSAESASDPAYTIYRPNATVNRKSPGTPLGHLYIFSYRDKINWQTLARTLAQTQHCARCKCAQCSLRPADSVPNERQQLFFAVEDFGAINFYRVHT